MKSWAHVKQIKLILSLLGAFSLVFLWEDEGAWVLLAHVVITVLVLLFWFKGLQGAFGAVRRRRYLHLISSAGLLCAAGTYVWLSLWWLRPSLLPQQLEYDFIANRQVTERLVDPALLRVERWEVMGDVRETLFVHPTEAGSTALVYPVRLEGRTFFHADLAVAPEAWTAEGDGVTFSVYVEDQAGMHLLFSRYVDPKHHELDRSWLPVDVDLWPYRGKLVRVILVTGSGPAGDLRYDWAGWGEPRLERSLWPWEMIQRVASQD